MSYSTDANTAKTDYENLMNTLNVRASNAKNQYETSTSNLNEKYKNIYGLLDQEDTGAHNTAYADSNTVDTNSNANAMKVQNIMAKYGWTGGGENVQAQMDTAEARKNGQTNVKNVLGNTLNDILNRRNTNKITQQNELNSLYTKIQDTLASLDSEANNAKSTYNARLSAISAAEQARQQAAAAARAAKAAATNKTDDTLAILETYRNGVETNLPATSKWLSDNQAAIIKAGGMSLWNQLADDFGGRYGATGIATTPKQQETRDYYNNTAWSASKNGSRTGDLMGEDYSPSFSLGNLFKSLIGN